MRVWKKQHQTRNRKDEKTPRVYAIHSGRVNVYREFETSIFDWITVQRHTGLWPQHSPLCSRLSRLIRHLRVVIRINWFSGRILFFEGGTCCVGWQRGLDRS